MSSSNTGSSASSSKKNKKKRHSMSHDEDDNTLTATTELTSSSSSSSIRVKVVESNPSHDPIVCSFPGGVPTNPLTFQWYQKKNSKKSSHNKLDTASSVEYVLKGHDEACQYYGSCTSSSSVTSESSSHNTKLCVGIYDKQTNVVTFYPTAGNGAVISLQQFVPSYHHSKEQNRESNGVSTKNNNSSSSSNSNALLYADFGSAKKRRVLQSQEANRVTVDAVVGDATQTHNDSTTTTTNTAFDHPAMSESNRSAIQHQQQINMALAATSTTSTLQQQSQTTTTSSIHLAAELATSHWRQTFLPPYDSLATCASQIYSVNAIAGPTVWNITLPNRIQTMQQQRRGTTTTSSSSMIIQYLNRKRHSHATKSSKDDIVYCTDIVADLLNTSSKYHTSSNNESPTSNFFKCTLLLNYFICVFHKFQQQKFRMPALIDMVENDDDDDDDDDDIEMNDATNTDDEPKANRSFRGKLYGSTPVMVLQRFLELFTSSLSMSGGNNKGGGSNQQQQHTKCVMSRAQQDKCLVHIFVLYILSTTMMNRPRNKKNNNNNDDDNDKTIVIHDIMPLLNELQLSDKINHGILLLREAGCIVTRVSSQSSSTPQKKIKVELSVPLTFPKMKKKQRA